MTAMPTFTSAGDALLWDVLCEPWDDAPRLILADWLEEHGQPKRAEFIRLQVELAKYPDQVEWLCNMPVAQWAGTEEEGRLLRRLDVLRRRGRELEGLPFTSERAVFGDKAPTRYRGWCFARGFVESVSLPLADFMAHASALFRAAPLTDVQLSDVRPYRDERRCYYYFSLTTHLLSGSNLLPRALFDCMPGPYLADRWYASEADALVHLSAACVSWGRTLAGLPPLPPPGPCPVH
jgi:uncharacterized protein (TIGR02996 family)